MEFLREFYAVRSGASALAQRLLGRLLDAGRSARPGGARLVIFMRILAPIWAWQGLLQWGALLLPRESVFDKLPALYGAGIIFFAAFDLVAAAGLWLATPWGGVLWVLAALAQFFACFFLPGLFTPFWAGAGIVLIAIYFALTWAARRPPGAARPRSSYCLPFNAARGSVSSKPKSTWSCQTPLMRR